MPINYDKFNKDMLFGSFLVQFVFTALGWTYQEFTKPYAKYQYSLMSEIITAFILGLLAVLAYLNINGVIVDKKIRKLNRKDGNMTERLPSIMGLERDPFVDCPLDPGLRCNCYKLTPCPDCPLRDLSGDGKTDEV